MAYCDPNVREKCAAGVGILQPDRRELGERQQQLASSLAQLADLLAELLGDLDDLLSDVGFARLAQFIFVVGLDDDRRENSDHNQNNQTNRQADVRHAEARQVDV